MDIHDIRAAAYLAANDITNLPPRAELPGGVEQWRGKVFVIVHDLLQKFSDEPEIGATSLTDISLALTAAAEAGQGARLTAQATYALAYAMRTGKPLPPFAAPASQRDAGNTVLLTEAADSRCRAQGGNTNPDTPIHFPDTTHHE